MSRPLTQLLLAQAGAYGSPGHDPRMRTVSVAWLAFRRVERTPHAGSDARAARWLPVGHLPADLAFDHAQILHVAVAQARSHVQDVRVAASFLPPVFTLSQVRRVYEAVWGLELAAPNFQRRILALTGGAAEDQRPLLRTEADGIVDTTTSRRSKHVLKVSSRAHDLTPQSCRFGLPR